MPEQFFRYVPIERAHLWEQAGWKVISAPLAMRPPLEFEHANSHAIDVVIMEWLRPGSPVEPNAEQRKAAGLD